jgi:hypothetical protein
LKVDIATVTARHADIARKAFRRYGRGRHAAKSQFWRLFCLRPRKGPVSAIAVQRRGFRADRCDGGAILTYAAAIGA